MAYQQRERARRNRFTLNNPFITDDVKVLDPDAMTDEQKALLGKEVKHDFSFIRQPQFAQYFDFAIVEYDQKENKRVIGKVVSERCFFKNYAAACEYFARIDFIRYVCFQYEKGEEGRFIARDRLQAMFSSAAILIASYRKNEGDSGSRHCMQKAKEYGRKRYVLYNEATDAGRTIFGLNAELLADGVPALTPGRIGEL